MANSSYVQASFLGGEWSKAAQGRVDLPAYRTALNVCFNSLPIEEGAWTRRGGTALLGPTRRGMPAKLIGFFLDNVSPLQLEISFDTGSDTSFLRFDLGDALVLDGNPAPPTITALDTSSPAQMTIGTSEPDWATGDTVIVMPGSPAAGWTSLYNRHLRITVVDDTHFTLQDDLTAADIDGSTFAAVPGGTTVARVTTLLLTYYTRAAVDTVRGVPVGDSMVLLASDYDPVLFEVPTSNGAIPTSWRVTQKRWKDGPYLTAPESMPVSGWVDGTTGSVTFYAYFQIWDAAAQYFVGDKVTYPGGGGSGIDYVAILDTMGDEPDTDAGVHWTPIASGTMVNGTTNGGWTDGLGFVAGDVSRTIRLLSQPLDWDIGTTYAIGDTVTWNGAQWVSLTAGNVGMQPDQFVADWQPALNAILWVRGEITAQISANSVTILLSAALPYGQVITTWAISINGFPNGVFYDGRLWVAGSAANRIDGSVSNDIFNFAPTDEFGVVSDNNAVSLIINAPGDNQILWMQPTNAGLLLGTAAGEWLIERGAAALTPSNVGQAVQVTRYGCQNVEPRRMGNCIAFVQRFGRRVFEYLADVFSTTRFSGRVLNVRAKHLSNPGITKLAYQEELTPVLWALNSVDVSTPGNVIGCTYRRISNFITEEPAFYGWHRHTLGGPPRTVYDISTGPRAAFAPDALFMVTFDGTYHYVEMKTDLVQEEATI